jgi:hypothetical protein
MLSKRICFVLLNGREFHGLICFFGGVEQTVLFCLMGRDVPCMVALKTFLFGVYASVI